jgi:hypothetical protein
MDFDAERMQNALGIAGSLAAGCSNSPARETVRW